MTGNVDHIYLADTRKKTVHSTCFEIHLRPTSILLNLLPVPLYVLACGTVTEDVVLPGQSRHMTSVELGTFIVLKVKCIFVAHAQTVGRTMAIDRNAGRI